MSLTNQQLIHQFYQSFQKGDAEKMIACYHPRATFEDPAFGQLNSSEAGFMWRMLTERSKGNLVITYKNVWADEENGLAQWEAIYPFPKSGRIVHNKINASFTFQDGLIVGHKDQFNLWQWSSMALGWTGKLLGWTPFLQKKIQQQTRGMLNKYIAKQ